jgi:hypothetical protein
MVLLAHLVVAVVITTQLHHTKLVALDLMQPMDLVTPTVMLVAAHMLAQVVAVVELVQQVEALLQPWLVLAVKVTTLISVVLMTTTEVAAAVVHTDCHLVEWVEQMLVVAQLPVVLAQLLLLQTVAAAVVEVET